MVRGGGGIPTKANDKEESLKLKGLSYQCTTSWMSSIFKTGTRVPPNKWLCGCARLTTSLTDQLATFQFHKTIMQT